MHNNKVSCALTILYVLTPLVVSEIPILQMVKLNKKYVVTHLRPPSLERWDAGVPWGPGPQASSFCGVGSTAWRQGTAINVTLKG